MKVPKRKPSRCSEQRKEYPILENQLLAKEMPVEKFEHWGYLVYTYPTSDKICKTLAGKVRHSTN